MREHQVQGMKELGRAEEVQGGRQGEACKRSTGHSQECGLHGGDCTPPLPPTDLTWKLQVWGRAQEQEAEARLQCTHTSSCFTRAEQRGSAPRGCPTRPTGGEGGREPGGTLEGGVGVGWGLRAEWGFCTADTTPLISWASTGQAQMQPTKGSRQPGSAGAGGRLRLPTAGRSHSPRSHTCRWRPGTVTLRHNNHTRLLGVTEAHPHPSTHTTESQVQPRRHRPSGMPARARGCLH